MSELKVRIINKHDTEENWQKATNFVAKAGEIIVYDKDSSSAFSRIKIGDGETNINDLPFTNTYYLHTIEFVGVGTNDSENVSYSFGITFSVISSSEEELTKDTLLSNFADKTFACSGLVVYDSYNSLLSKVLIESDSITLYFITVGSLASSQNSYVQITNFSSYAIEDKVSIIE